MEGVTTAAVVFIFVCIAFPRLIRRRTQYYGAVTAVLLILLLGCADALVHSENFHRFFGFMMYLLDFAAVLLLIMCSGGLSPRELFGEMTDALHELRHGPDADKPVIVPLSGEKPRPRAGRTEANEEQDAHRYTLDAGGRDDAGA